MAHYAYIDETNTVTAVIVGPDEGTEPEGVESWEDYFSAKGKGRALRTSYNTIAGQHTGDGEPFRGNYAGVGYTYDETLDAFVPPKPFESWVLNETSFTWEAPLPMPNDAIRVEGDGGGAYAWSEDLFAWELISE